MVFGCECIPHLSPMTHNEQDTHESFGVALIMVMSFVDISSPKSPLAFVVTINDCAFKIVILLFSNVGGEKKIGGPWHTPGSAFREIILWNV